MTEYVPTQENANFYSGATGTVGTTVAGTFPPNGGVTYDMFGTITDPDVVGFKVVLDADGVGDLFFELDAYNVGVGTGSPLWTADPDASHIALHNDYSPPSSLIHVSGPTHYEWQFYWPGDPMFGGFVFNDPLSDFLLSLSYGTTGTNQVFGELDAKASNAGTITVSRFDLVLYTRPRQSTMRKYPNPTGLGVGPVRHWPRPRRGVTGIR